MRQKKPTYENLEGLVKDFESEIKERSRIEDSLRESEERFRLLAENANASIAIIQDNKFVYVNPKTAQITGYTKEELLSMDDFIQTFTPDYRDFVRARRAPKSIRGESVASQYEAKVLTKSGKVKWLEFSPTLLRYEGKTASAAIAIDITERK